MRKEEAPEAPVQGHETKTTYAGLAICYIKTSKHMCEYMRQAYVARSATRESNTGVSSP